MRITGSDSSATWSTPKVEKPSEPVGADAPAQAATKWAANPAAVKRPLLTPGAAVTPTAAMTAQHFLALRGDAAQVLAGASLTNEVGAAMQLAPNHEPSTAAQAEQLEQGAWPFYSGAQADTVKTVTDSILAVSGHSTTAHVACLPLTYTDPKSQKAITLPLFRVDNADGTTRGFVDNVGRQYRSIAQWKAENTLPPGEVTYPANGHLRATGSGQPALVSEPTASSIDTPLEHVVDWVEKAGLVGGFAVGAAALVGVGGVVVPLAGAALALGFGGKAIAGLVDAALHGETLNPLTSASARSNWLTAGASVVGLGAGAAASVAARELAGAGRLGSLVARAAPALGVSAEALGASQTAVGAVDLVRDWSKLSVKERMLATSQLVFFGALTAKSASQAGGLQQLYSPSQTRARLEAAARPVVKARPTDEAAPDLVAPSLRLLANTKGLLPADRAQLEVMLSGKNARSQRAQAALNELAQTSRFIEAPSAEQLAMLRKAYQASAPLVVSDDVASKLRLVRLKSTTVSQPVALKAFNWELKGWSRAPAQRVEVSVRGRTIPVVSPVDGTFASAAKEPLVNHSYEELTDALSMLPLDLLARVKEVRLSPVPNPMDAYWAKVYDRPDMASYMTCGQDGVVTVFPWKQELAGSTKDLATNLMHELGHQFSMSEWGENSSRGRRPEWTRWARAMQDDGLSVSSYGDSSIAEDVAEANALRSSLLLHRDLLSEYLQLFPNRFAILEEASPAPDWF